jgi:D-alanyl-D-alanine carboxypeptidase/D-alanyl-D-alanine-endopeptidase (penicillin-binding protein 4)
VSRCSHWYGTGHSALNWRENEFTIAVQPGSSVNAPARLGEIKNPPPHLQIINELITASSDDEPSLYFSLNGSNIRYLRGVVSLDAPPDFTVHCSVPNSALYAADELTKVLRTHGIEIEGEATVDSGEKEKLTQLDIHRSPPLSKLLEPFLRISINMYGEVFVKTIARHTGLSSLTDAPMTILPLYIKTLFNDKNLLAGVATTDGSGLSRGNRLTTYALAQILFQVQKEPWFNDKFFEAFPTISGLRMKSGTLMNTIAYAGYVRENSFVFSFMINNYQGENVTNIRKRVWSVLDTLK